MSTIHQDPPREDRWIGGRTAPGIIRLRTRWLYSSDPMAPEVSRRYGGRRLWPFSRSGRVYASDWVPHWERERERLGTTGLDLATAIHEAVESFGDDADLEIEIRLARPRGDS